MKLFGAIDLHSNNNVTVLIDERDEVVYRKGRKQREGVKNREGVKIELHPGLLSI